MTVHNLAEYVAYHQAKLREQNPPQSQPQPSRPAKRYGVNPISSKTSFNTSVVEQKGKVVLLDCFATWCGPCKMIAPKISAMSQEEKYKDSVDFYKIDVDEVSDVAGELGIRAMPTFIVFKDGEKVDEVVGANEKAIRAAVDKYL